MKKQWQIVLVAENVQERLATPTRWRMWSRA